MSTASYNRIVRDDGAEPRGSGTLSLSEVAHDVRQPLAAIGALVTSAERQPDLPPPVRRCLQQIRLQVEELNKLCRRMFGNQERSRTRVRVHDLARSAAEVVTLATGRTVPVVAGTALVDGDEVDLRRALLNLLENACRATGPRGQVCVRVRPGTGGEVRVEVHDDGPGFGLGAPGNASLGLDIVRGVAADHGGHLEIAQSDLGGASVSLVLPSASAAASSVTRVVWSDKDEDSTCES